jgi:hypothetical protein
MATQFENASIIESIVAHYLTAKGRRGMKSFDILQLEPEDRSSAAVLLAFTRWERSVERMGYDIDCVDTYYLGSGRAGNTQTEFVGPIQMRSVTNLMSGKQVWESMDTPYSCSVGSETYWSS